jgi:IS5 family transposase
VVRQLDARGLTVRTGTLVDATMVRAASDRDRQAGWKCYGKDAPAKGYKAHVATDESGSIMQRVDKRSGPRLNAAKRAWNARIHPVRCSIEKVFGTVKRSYGLARARYLGRRRVSLQVHLAFLAGALAVAARFWLSGSGVAVSG